LGIFNHAVSQKISIHDINTKSIIMIYSVFLSGKKCCAASNQYLLFTFKIRKRSRGVFKKCPLPFTWLSCAVVHCMNADDVWEKWVIEL